MRHIQVQIDMVGQEVGRHISPNFRIDDLTENTPKTFSFKIPPIPQMTFPDSINVQRNLTLILHDGNVSASIAFVDFLKKPDWQCNLADIPIEKLIETKMFFSQYQGVTEDGDFRKVVDYVEFFDLEASGGNSKIILNGSLIWMLAVSIVSSFFSWVVETFSET